MATTSIATMWASLVIAYCAAVVAFHIQFANSADPDPLQVFCVADLSSTALLVNGFPCKPRDTVSAEDFTFTGLRRLADDISDSETGAIATLATVREWPGLNTLGISHARLEFAVDGVVPLHTHSRATETLFVFKGTIYTGFVSEDNVLFASTLYPGDLIIFSRALLHFQLNVGAITSTPSTRKTPGSW